MEVYKKKYLFLDKRERFNLKNISYGLKIVFILAIFFLGILLSNKIKSIYWKTTSYGKEVIKKNVFNVNNLTNGEKVTIDGFDLDVKFKDWQKIKYYREQTLLHTKIMKRFQGKVPAKIRYKGEIYKIELSLTGGTHKHLLDHKKWSLAVKVKGDKTIMGMKKFALLEPKARGYLTDWIAHKILKSRGVIGLRSNFIDVNINGDNYGMYYLEERFDKRLVENNELKEGIIFRFNLAIPTRKTDRNPDVDDLNFMNNIKIYNINKIKETPELSAQLILLQQLCYAYQNKDIDITQIFDLKKFASVYAVTDLLNAKHGLSIHNMRFYFNPITGLIEPIAREWSQIKENKEFGTLSIEGEANKANFYDNYYLRDSTFAIRLYDNILFKELYLKEVKIISNRFYLDSILLESKEEKDLLIAKIQRFDPFYIFPIKTLYKYQKFIREKIYPSTPSLKIYFESIKKDSLTLLIKNLTRIPNEINSIRYNDKLLSEGRYIVLSNYKLTDSLQSISFKIKNNYDSRLFSTDSLIIYYNVLGMDNSMNNYVGNPVHSKTIVFPKVMKSYDYFALNKAKRPPTLSRFDFLSIDEKTKVIKFENKICSIKEDLIIPKDYIISAKPNCKIDITNSARIISYSPFMFFGKKDSLITVFSSDSTGQGIVVFNCEQTSEFSYVNFENLSNISDEGWQLSGAITFYESPINIDNCKFYNNINGDDYLNTVRTHFNVTKTIFSNTNADAFDADFCTGKMENVKFFQIGNDAFDVSGSKIFLSDIEILNPADKGISGGENSFLTCQDITINGGEIGVACKDNSTINIDRIEINSTKLAYCAFQKKPEYGPGAIVANDAVLKNVNKSHLIETGSSLSLNNKTIQDKIDNVKYLLYGTEYGKESN